MCCVVERIPPSRPNVTRTSDTSVMVEWTVPVRNDSLAVVLFKVQFQQMKPRKRWRTVDDEIPASARHFEVRGLKTGLLFFVSICSYTFVY